MRLLLGTRPPRSGPAGVRFAPRRPVEVKIVCRRQVWGPFLKDWRSVDRWSARWRAERAPAICPTGEILMGMETINFTRGVPANESFPTAELIDAASAVLRSHGNQMLQYGPAHGFAPLRQWLAGGQRGGG